MSPNAGPEPALVASAAHVFVDDLEHPLLGDEDAHHLSRVLRLRAGESVSVSDGTGGWRLCRFVVGGTLEGVDEIRRQPRPQPELVIGFGIPKGDRPEWIVQKLTEIGADRIIPLHTERGVVRWDASRGTRHLERLRRVAREASSQSRRTWLPKVDEVTEAADLFGREGVGVASMSGEVVSLDTPIILIGPEGGWTEGELQRSNTTVGLGTTVMRVETATLVACTLLAQLRSR